MLSGVFAASQNALSSNKRYETTELAKKVCPRLRDLSTAPAGGITQPGTNFFGHLCTTQYKGYEIVTTLFWRGFSLLGERGEIFFRLFLFALLTSRGIINTPLP